MSGSVQRSNLDFFWLLRTTLHAPAKLSHDASEAVITDPVHYCTQVYAMNPVNSTFIFYYKAEVSKHGYSISI